MCLSVLYCLVALHERRCGRWVSLWSRAKERESSFALGDIWSEVEEVDIWDLSLSARDECTMYLIAIVIRMAAVKSRIVMQVFAVDKAIRIIFHLY